MTNDRNWPGAPSARATELSDEAIYPLTVIGYDCAGANGTLQAGTGKGTERGVWRRRKGGTPCACEVIDKRRGAGAKAWPRRRHRARTPRRLSAARAGPAAGAVLACVAISLATGCRLNDWTDPDARHYARNEWAARDSALRKGAGAVEHFESRYGTAWIEVLATDRDGAGRRCGRYRIEWPNPDAPGTTIRQEHTACERADGRWREQ